MTRRLLDPAWLRVAFVFIVIFGTKMGIAPMLPGSRTYGKRRPRRGAHGWRVDELRVPRRGARDQHLLRRRRLFVRPILGFGLVSLAIAAAFIVGQGDVGRLLAYSSVEHMGPFVLGLGSIAPAPTAWCFTR
jgi:hydrogenase-4 component F